MRKFSLFMLMAVGLLISGNAGAEHSKSNQLYYFQQTENLTKDFQQIAKAPQGLEEQSIDLTFNGITTNYHSLQEAFNNLPANSTPATVVLQSDVHIDYEGKLVTLAQYHNVTLDLNGYAIYGTTDSKIATAIIENYGTLTINDSKGTGAVYNLATNPDTWITDGKPFPSYTNNLFNNYGTMIINGGNYQQYSNASSGCAYIIDNYSGNHSPKLEINGGTFLNKNCDVIRLCCNSETNDNTLIINDGEFTGFNVFFVQTYTYYSKADVTINGGTFHDGANAYVKGLCDLKHASGYSRVAGAYYGYNVNINITGGVFDDNISFSYYTNCTISGRAEFYGMLDIWWTNTSITAGVFDFNGTYKDFYQYICEKDIWGMGCIVLPWTDPKTGKTFSSLDELVNDEDFAQYYIVEDYRSQGGPVGLYCDFNHIDLKADFEEDFVADGYYMKHIGTSMDDYLYEVVPKVNVEITGGTTIPADKQGEDVAATIKPSGSEDVVLIIGDDEGTKTNVDFQSITFESNDGKGEAQIVVKNGATLNVGNGGIVSENDILTTVLVETGGTLIVGTNGIDKEGNATPIEIKASEEKGTGVLIFSPNSQTEKTKNYAEVDLYTYCKKVGEKYYWQQFAIPVTGLANDKVAKNPNITSYVFAWDYSKYGWTQLSNWAELDEPFAGYDMTNISEAGGVVYTFKGDLIGNQNIQLTLPHKDYCVMGNSYTAPIDIVALFDQIDKEMDQTGEGTIEKTVYKYDAANSYYVYTNELEQTLHKMGIVPATFTEILPMEGFLLNLQNGNTAGVMLNYANAVFNPAMDKAVGGNNAPRQNNSTDLVVANINIKSAHSVDRMTMVEGDEFSTEIENGKDAFKYLNEGANLYAFDGTNKLAMVATDNLEGTMLAFQAAEDAEYTLTFDRALNTEYVLVDMMNGNEVAMTEGNTYTFFATPNTLDPARFMVKANAQAPTNMERTKAIKVAKGIYTITGQYLGESDQWNAMPQGVYMVNGVKVIK